MATETTTTDLAGSTEKLSISENEDISNGNAAEQDSPTDQEAGDNNDAGINLGRMHPLENEWSFWYDKRPASSKRVRGEQESYESNLREIGNFGTVSFTSMCYRFIEFMCLSITLGL